MGGSSGTRSAGPAPQQAQPINYGSLMQAASKAAIDQEKLKYKLMIENYPAMETLSLGTVDRIAGRLGATPQPIYDMVAKKDGRGNVIGYERKQVGMSEGNAQTAEGLAAVRNALSLYDAKQADPTSIEQKLYNDAETELGLGRSLSAEDERVAQQSARSAFAARGIGTSLGSSAAEILGRQALADQRLAERRNFASATNNMLTNNVGQRTTGLANLAYTGANNLMALDPYQRALGPGLNYSQGTQGNQMQQMSNTFQSANQLAGDVAAYNGSMLDSRYNSWANLQAANQAAAAQRQAGMYGMLGNIGGGLLGGGLMALSDKREKTEIKPLGKSGSVLGLKTYSYRYKGDDKKRIGVMAQDVKKVLPEAVEEVNYKGKKRLAIRPAVIGQALAEELAAQAA